VLYNPRTTDPQYLHCRNPRCRSELPAPAHNLRNAFCCRGCESGFYRTHCRVCERPLPREKTTGRPRELCSDHCRNEFRRHQERFLSRFYSGPNTAPKRPKTPSGYLVSKTSENPLRSPIKSRTKISVLTDRTWRVVAGPAVSDANLGIQLDPETIGRIERDRRALRNYFRRLGERALFQRNTPPINIVGGFIFPNAPEIDHRPIAKAKPAPVTTISISTTITISTAIGADLEIPDFLRRTRPPAFEAAE
jgi:predicted nucleic acid-binding Zn ribbon protein